MRVVRERKTGTSYCNENDVWTWTSHLSHCRDGGREEVGEVYGEGGGEGRDEAGIGTIMKELEAHKQRASAFLPPLPSPNLRAVYGYSGDIITVARQSSHSKLWRLQLGSHQLNRAATFIARLLLYLLFIIMLMVGINENLRSLTLEAGRHALGLLSPRPFCWGHTPCHGLDWGRLLNGGLQGGWLN